MNIYQLGKSWFSEQAGGGADRVFAALMRHLSGPSTSVRGVVVGSAPTLSEPGATVSGIASETDGLWTRWRAVRRCVKNDFAVQSPDVVAGHFALYTAPVLDLLRDTPTVVHFHGPWAAESAAEGESLLKTRIKALLERLTYRSGHRFIVLSDAFRTVLCTRYGISDDRVHVVPGGIDADRFSLDASPSTARERLGWPTNRPIILSVRRLARRMGLSNLITAMERVVQAHPDALLLIAGKGPLREELAAMIEAKNLEQHVRLLGFVPEADLPFAYRAATLSIVPTVEHEGFGLITIESLAAGTPVLVTPVGGLPETVRNLSRNLILPDAETETVGTALVSALDGSLSLPGPEQCRHYARSRFDWPVIASKVRDVYVDVL